MGAAAEVRDLSPLRRPIRRPRAVLGGISFAAALVALVAFPGPVAAHGLAGRFESPLPLAVYLVGAGLAVALSFALVMIRDVRAAPRDPGRESTVPRAVILGVRLIGVVAWAWIVAQTVIGGSSAADVGSLFLWVYGWVGVAALSALLGPVWTWLDPFATLHDAIAWVMRRLGIRPWPRSPYPSRLGQWPAVVGFAFFVWLELVHPAGGGGPMLGVALVAYTALTLVMMGHFGRDRWRANGETFSVWFGTLGRAAPFVLTGGRRSHRVRRRGFASGLVGSHWSVARLVLVTLATGAILYDGLSQTQLWFELFGFGDLVAETVLLAAFLSAVVVVVLVVARAVGAAALGPGLLPIAVGYLVAHYLTYVLGDGQRIIVALSDPFQLGWDLFGTAFYEPTTDWLPSSVLWTVQLVAVVGGHVVGAWAGHAAASREPRGRVRVRQLPLAALMVALTVTTLWSLGQTIVSDPGAEQGSAALSEATAARSSVAAKLVPWIPAAGTPS